MENGTDGACINHTGQQGCMRNVFGTPAEQIRHGRHKRNALYSRERIEILNTSDDCRGGWGVWVGVGGWEPVDPVKDISLHHFVP